MTSFIRTARREETREYIEEILSRRDHFIPLRFRPRRAHPGDFIYLAHRGSIVGRALISRLQDTDKKVPIGSEHRAYPARCLVWYEGGWQRPRRRILFKGYVGIRYLDTMRMEELDGERW
jgi:hypothetical protein